MVEGNGGGHGHQYHSGEDADIGKAHGILLHPVQKARHGSEVPGLVVVTGVCPQGLQHCHGTGSEQAVGTDHHQHYRQEKEDQGLYGVVHLPGEEVPAPCGQQAQHRQQPSGFGLPLPGRCTAEQLHGAGPADADQIAHQCQSKEGGKEGGGVRNAPAADLKTKFHRKPGDLEQQQQCQLAEEDAGGDTARNGGQGTVKGLPQTQQGDVPFFQPEDVVKSQLPLTLLHGEAVGIEQQNAGKESHHDAPQIHQALEIRGTPDGGDDVAFRQVAENVEHGGSAAAGEKIGTVVPAVAQQVYQGQPGEETGLTHGPRLPLPGPSGCRRCGGTGSPGSLRPDRAGGTPRRPGGTVPGPHDWQPLPNG